MVLFLLYNIISLYYIYWIWIVRVYVPIPPVQYNITVLCTEYGLLEYGSIPGVQYNITVLYTEYGLLEYGPISADFQNIQFNFNSWRIVMKYHYSQT